jgi:hypothetical protein
LRSGKKMVWKMSFSSSRTRASEPCRRGVSRLKLICRTSPSGLLDPWHPLLVRTHPFLLTPQVSRAHMRVLPVCGSCPSPLRLARLASQDGATSVFVASMKGHLEVVERLIAAGAKVDAVFKVAPTPLPLPPPSPPPIHCCCKVTRAAAVAQAVICVLLFLPPLPPLPPGRVPLPSTRQKGRVEVVGWLVAATFSLFLSFELPP